MNIIILDSFCKISNSFIKLHNLELINIPFVVNDEVLNYEDYTKKDYSTDTFSNLFLQEELLNKQELLNFFESKLSENKNVYYICTIDKRSANYDLITQVIKELKDKYFLNFIVIYLPSCCFASRDIVLKVISIMNSRESVEKFAKYEIKNYLGKYTTLAIIDDKQVMSEYIERPTQLLSFGLKPIYVESKNNSDLLCKAEGLTLGVNRLASIIKQTAQIEGDAKHLTISFAKNKKYADLLENQLKTFFGDKIRVDKIVMNPLCIKKYGLGAIIVSFKGSI